MWSNGIPLPSLGSLSLAAGGKNFWKSTFKFCSLYYENITINAVKWHSSPPLGSPLPCRQRWNFVWKSTFKLCSSDHKTLTINVVKWHPSPTCSVASPPAARGKRYVWKLRLKLCSLYHKNLTINAQSNGITHPLSKPLSLPLDAKDFLDIKL